MALSCPAAPTLPPWAGQRPVDHAPRRGAGTDTPPEPCDTLCIRAAHLDKHVRFSCWQVLSRGGTAPLAKNPQWLPIVHEAPDGL